jgi:hypothetical protein
MAAIAAATCGLVATVTEKNAPAALKIFLGRAQGMIWRSVQAQLCPD